MEKRKENGKKEKEKEKEKEGGRKREKGTDASVPIAVSGCAWPTGGRTARDGTTAWKKREGGKEMTERCKNSGVEMAEKNQIRV